MPKVWTAGLDQRLSCSLDSDLFEAIRRHFLIEWGDIQIEIEKEIKRREAA
jgi:hypothetical protein